MEEKQKTHESAKEIPVEERIRRIEQLEKAMEQIKEKLGMK